MLGLAPVEAGVRRRLRAAGATPYAAGGVDLSTPDDDDWVGPCADAPMIRKEDDPATTDATVPMILDNGDL